VRRGVLRWTTDGYDAYRTGKDLSVEAASKDGRTELRVKSHLANLAGGLFGGLMGGLGLGCGLGIGMGMGLGELHSLSFAILFSMGSLGLSYLLARAIYVSAAKRLRKDIDRLASGLEEGLAKEQT
jgi:predicted lipid-binding transport protein (Tim44 family)